MSHWAGAAIPRHWPPHKAPTLEPALSLIVLSMLWGLLEMPPVHPTSASWDRLPPFHSGHPGEEGKNQGYIGWGILGAGQESSYSGDASLKVENLE